jgi:3-hydroxymyristoyl/3-hydroxydecanoyl-(acyl carrier protein) dehydratase
VGWRRREGGEDWNVFEGCKVEIDGEGRLVVDSPYAMERPLAMGDAARLAADGRHFALLGRTDRRVKILEEYVQLGDVERALESHPLVAAARAEAWGEGVVRIGVLVVPSAEGREALAGGTFGEVRRRLRQDLLQTVGKLAFPRRIRFVRALPADGRGKTTSAAARAALADWCQEPVVLEWKATADSLRAVVVFPPDTECFDGHFPGYAILPGVAQLYFLRHFAVQAFGEFPGAGTWRRIKFQKIGRPGERLILEVERRGEKDFAFSYSKASGLVSSGMVEGGAR